MAQLNSLGPQNIGAEKGRKLGLCAHAQTKYTLGLGRGLRVKNGGGKGNAKRKNAGYFQ